MEKTNAGLVAANYSKKLGEPPKAGPALGQNLMSKFTSTTTLPNMVETGFKTETQERAAIDRSCYPVLQNIVSTVNLSCKLDLKQIALNARNAEYNPKRFAAVIIRLRDPKTTALVFASGKMVVTGAKSEQNSLLAARKYARMIQKLGFEVVFKDFKIQNIVGSCDVKFPIKLDELHTQHKQFCSYEPEMFPGLIYKMQKPKIVLLIFVSGKLVLTGAKTKADIDQAFEQIYYVLLTCKKPQ